jgi:hypothetical protein
MADNKKNRSKIVDTGENWGVLVWQLPDGKILGNGHGDVLSMEAERGDLRAVKEMQQAAAYYGYPEGQTLFMPGRKKLTQSEWEDSMAMMRDGQNNPWDSGDL